MTKYLRLANRLKEQIEQNPLRQGYKLPTEQELCETYHISRQTVRMALSILEEDGYIVRKQGSGSYASYRSQDKSGLECALLFPSNTDYLYPTAMNNIQHALKQTNNVTAFYNTEYDVIRERTILTKLLQKDIRVLLTEGCQTALPNPNLDLYRQFIDKETPLLFLGYPYPQLEHVSYLHMDDFYGGYILGKYLISKHHTRIGGLFQVDSLTGIERFHGLMSACKDMHWNLNNRLIGWFDAFTYESIQKEQNTSFLKEFIKKHAAFCSCIVCHNDEIAYWLIKELLACGYHIPDDICVTGFDNSYLSDLSSVPITTLAPKTINLSALLDRLLTFDQPIRETVSWKLIEKGST